MSLLCARERESVSGWVGRGPRTARDLAWAVGVAPAWSLDPRSPQPHGSRRGTAAAEPHAQRPARGGAGRRGRRRRLSVRTLIL